MNRKPLPPEHPTHPMNAAEIMLMLRDQVGLPLRDVIDLDLQTIHDLLAANIDPSDVAQAERIVVVDDDTIGILDQVVTAGIAAARSDRRVFDGYEGWTSRPVALERLGPDYAGKSLAELDAALQRTEGRDKVVLEEDDYRRVLAALNAAVSARPHGRSRKLDGVDDEPAARTAAAFTAAHRGRVRVPALDGHNADALDREVAGRLTVATMALMEKEFAPDVRPNPRPVLFTFAPVGETAELARTARNEGKDIICALFERGREHEGPTSYAVFEMRNGRLSTWKKCDPWSPPGSSDLVLRARAGAFCFAYDGERIVLYHGRPEGPDALLGIAKARRMLESVANSPPDDHLDAPQGG